MLERGALKDALRRATQEGRTAEVAHPQACLERLLQEIDTVVLPRDVRFDNGAGQTLSLTIKSRRLIRVNAPVPRALGALPGVVDEDLGGADSQMAALAHVLAGFAAHATQLTLAVTEPARPEVLTDVGLSVRDLRQALRAAGYALASGG
ncbi:MAG: hypothetical protein AAFY25_00945, partial [Pseudomonadota bacterium]